MSGEWIFITTIVIILGIVGVFSFAMWEGNADPSMKFSRKSKNDRGMNVYQRILIGVGSWFGIAVIFTNCKTCTAKKRNDIKPGRVPAKYTD